MISQHSSMCLSLRRNIFSRFILVVSVLATAACSINVTESDATVSSASIPMSEVTGYFENKVFDTSPEELFAENDYITGPSGSTDPVSTNDTERVVEALKRASVEDANGGVVILRGSKNGLNKRYRLGRVDVPSNVRIEIDPDVTLEMVSRAERFLFAVGRSVNANKLSVERVRNVEITSTHPTKYFTIDARTNKPLDYTGDGTMIGGSSRFFAIPVGFFYVENFSVSNVMIEDNHTVSVSIQLYPDTNYGDGAYAIRHNPKRPVKADRKLDVFLDGPNGKPLPVNTRGDFIDADGNVIQYKDAIVRNDTWGRTARKGTIQNIRANKAHTGYGAVQLYGGDWVSIKNIEAFNGIGVRLEAGNGTDSDKMNRAGPHNASISNIEISDVKVTQGFTGVWMNAHGKINKNIVVNNVTAIDSGSAIIVEKGTLCRECRDFIRGRFENTRVTGNISLVRTGKAAAEVGFLTTFFMAESEREAIKDSDGNGRITTADLPRNRSGHRWYLIQPTAPILALSQLSELNIGDQSEEEGFFAIDYSAATITGTNLLRPEKILYREDMIRVNGASAHNFINK